MHAAQYNGHTATAAELAPLAFAGYAHFTAMQVRDGRVRGLDLHLDRLRNASLRLFGRAVPDATVRERLRAAVAAGPADVSLTANVHAAEGEFTSVGVDAEPRLLVRTDAPFGGPTGPLALDLVEHERMLPDIKHVGEIAKTHYLREAVARGFDDVAFADRSGRISEASIWNLAFWDGEAVVWPQAELLTGTTMGIVRRRLERAGVPQVERELTRAELPGLTGAVVMNSWTPAVPVSRIETVGFSETGTLVGVLREAFAAEEPVAV